MAGMMKMKKMMLAVCLVAAAGVIVTRAQEEVEGPPLRFAVLFDTSVDPQYVQAVFQPVCAPPTAAAAALDPTRSCHLDALAFCEEVEEAGEGGRCGGYVIEPIYSSSSSSQEEVGFVVKVFSEEAMMITPSSSSPSSSLLLRSLPGAIMYEKRAISAYSEDFDLFLSNLEGEEEEEEDEDEEERRIRAQEEMDAYIEAALEDDDNVQLLRKALDIKISRKNAVTVTPGGTLNVSPRNAITDPMAKYSERQLAERLAQEEAVVIEKAISSMSLEKFGKKTVTQVVCTPGSFKGGIIEYAKYIPAKKARYIPKRCTPATFVPKLCACTPPVITPKVCGGSFFIPKRPAVKIPEKVIPKRKIPGTCTVTYEPAPPKEKGYLHPWLHKDD